MKPCLELRVLEGGWLGAPHAHQAQEKCKETLCGMLQVPREVGAQKSKVAYWEEAAQRKEGPWGRITGGFPAVDRTRAPALPCKTVPYAERTRHLWLQVSLVPGAVDGLAATGSETTRLRSALEWAERHALAGRASVLHDAPTRPSRASAGAAPAPPP